MLLPPRLPFSMTMIALIMIPWIRTMREINVEPRVLADDLMFTARGDTHRADTIEAMKRSKQYFTDIGAKVADNKCFTFASDAYTRNLLRNYSWDKQGTKIPCSSSFRDLGSHLNLMQCHNGATLTARMHKAAGYARRLRWMPISLEMKEK